jgi:hypothetical protein
MNFKVLQHWFDKQIEEAWYRAQNARKSEGIEMASGSANAVMKAQGPRLGSIGGPVGALGHGMNFTIYHANGGHVLEYNEYDPITDRRTQKLYIISSDKDLGQGLAEIITLEHLRK